MDISNESTVLDILVLPKSSTDEPIELHLYSLLKSERQTSLVFNSNRAYSIDIDQSYSLLNCYDTIEAESATILEVVLCETKLQLH